MSTHVQETTAQSLAPPATNPGAPPATPRVPLPPLPPAPPDDGTTAPPAPNPGGGTQPAPQPGTQPQQPPTNPPTDPEPPKPKVEYVVDSNVFMAGRTAILPYLNNKDVVIHLPEAANAQIRPYPDNPYRPVFAGGATTTQLLQDGTVTQALIILEPDPDMTGIDLRTVGDGGVISGPNGKFDLADAKIVETARVLGLTLLSHNATSLKEQIGSLPQRTVLWGGVNIREP